MKHTDEYHLGTAILGILITLALASLAVLVYTVTRRYGG